MGVDGQCPGLLELYLLRQGEAENANSPDEFPQIIAPDRVESSSDGFGVGCPVLNLKDVANGTWWLALRQAPNGQSAQLNYRTRVSVTVRKQLGEVCDASTILNLCAAGLACRDENRDGDGICVER